MTIISTDWIRQEKDAQKNLMVWSQKKKREDFLFRARIRYQQHVIQAAARRSRSRGGSGEENSSEQLAASTSEEQQQHPTSTMQDDCHTSFTLHDNDQDERDSDDKEEKSLYDVALTRGDQFSHDMIKYWKQRHMLFSLFDGSSATGEMPLLDRVGWFSVTPEAIAARIAQRCRCNTVLDAFCGVGGNAIQFALTCQRVIALDLDPIKVRLAQHNARIYGVDQYITFLQGDWRDFVQDWSAAHAQLIPLNTGQEDEANRQCLASTTPNPSEKWQGCETADIDVVFLSPPWGGVDYRTMQGGTGSSRQGATAMPTYLVNGQRLVLKAEGGSAHDTTGIPLSIPTHHGGTGAGEGFYPMSALQPQSGQELLHAARRITSNVCMFLPRTIDLRELATMAREEYGDGTRPPKKNEVKKNLVDVEEHWLNGRCKALSCFFGGLAEWTSEDEEQQRSAQ